MRALALALLVLVAGLNSLVAAPPTVTSDEQELDTNTGAAIFRGNAVFTHDEFIVLADEIRYYRDEAKAVALGNVQATREGFRMVGESLTYFVQTRAFASGPFRLGSPPLLLEGSSFEGVPERIEFTDTTVYFGEPDGSTPSVKAQRVVLIPDESIETDAVKLGLGGVPLLSVLGYTGPLQDPGIRFSGEIGYRNELGGYFQTDTLIPFFGPHSLGLNLDAYSDRGVLAGPNYALRYEGNDRSLNLSLNTAYIHDNGDSFERGVDVLGNLVEEDRGWVKLDLKGEDLDLELEITGRLNWQSDSEVIRDFRENRFEADQQPDTFVEVVQLWGPFAFSAFVRASLHDDHAVDQRLPELRIDMAPVEILDTGIYHRGHASWTRVSFDNSLWRPNLFQSLEGESLFSESGGMISLGTYDNAAADECQRLDLYYGLDRPFRLGKGITFRPVAGLRYLHYSDLNSDLEPFLNFDSSVDRLLGELGADLEITFSRRWDTTIPTLRIDGLRHIFRPVVRYRYHPSNEKLTKPVFSNEAYRFPIIDLRPQTTILPVIDLGAMRQHDQLEQHNVLRTGVEQLLQTRNKDGSVRTLASLAVYRDFNFDEDALRYAGRASPYFDALYTRLTLHPTPFIDLAWENKTDPDRWTSDANMWRVSFRSAEKWRMSLLGLHLENDVLQYGIEGIYRINRDFAVGGQFFYDDRRNEWIEQRYRLSQRVGRSWEITYQISVLDGSSREDDWRFSISVALLRF